MNAGASVIGDRVSTNHRSQDVSKFNSTRSKGGIDHRVIVIRDSVAGNDYSGRDSFGICSATDTHLAVVVNVAVEDLNSVIDVHAEPVV